MRTHLVAVFGITLSVALGAAVGCGAEVDPQGTVEETAVQSDAYSAFMPLLSIDVPHFYTVRRDLRRCRYPMCGGWFVQEVNTRAPAVYVSDLQFSPARLEQDVMGAPERDLVLRGGIQPADRQGRRALQVAEAYRGMPGFERAPDDLIYAVRCLLPTCEAATAHVVDTASTAQIERVSVDPVLAPRVPGDWLLDRVEHHGALVAGHLAPGGATATGAPGRELTASQVFVGLTDATGPCQEIFHTCAAPLVAAYVRNADLCREFVACVRPGACPLYRPACAEGYDLAMWPTTQGGCPAFACDPAFLTE